MSGLKIGSLCAGYGGLEEGVRSVLGGEVAWQSEIDPGACKILAHRYPGVPNLGDMTVIDWASVEPVDVLCGGTPCQDLSAAGKRAGMTEGSRSNLWVAMREAIAQLRPSLVVWENVRGAYSAHADSELESREGRVGIGGDGPVLRALGRVLGDLSSLGYDASWQGLRAADVGAPHGRFRVFVTAWPAGDAAVRGRDGARPAGRSGERSGPARGSGLAVAADPEGHGRHEGRPEPARLIGGPDTALSGGAVAANADRDGLGRLEELHGVPRAGSEGRGDRDDADGLAVATGGVDWGRYGDAIRRWERCLGRPAPEPTERGKNGQPRLAPRFVEWLMGLPAGWVTDVPGLTRNEMLKALGNGVVPQQAAAAVRMLLSDAEIPSGTAPAALLPTPKAASGGADATSYRPSGSKGTVNLEGALRAIATPASLDETGGAA